MNEGGAANTGRPGSHTAHGWTCRVGALWWSQARPALLLPAVLRVILSHVLDEVRFLQAFVSW